MKCEICNKRIEYNLTFRDFFTFKYICKSCIKMNELKDISIPIDYGYLAHLIYFLDDIEYLIESTKYIEQKIIEYFIKNHNKFILIYDEDDIYFYRYLMFKEDIFIINFNDILDELYLIDF